MCAFDELLVDVLDGREVKAMSHDRCSEHRPQVPAKCRPHDVRTPELDGSRAGFLSERGGSDGDPSAKLRGKQRAIH